LLSVLSIGVLSGSFGLDYVCWKTMYSLRETICLVSLYGAFDLVGSVSEWERIGTQNIFTRHLLPWIHRDRHEVLSGCCGAENGMKNHRISGPAIEGEMT